MTKDGRLKSGCTTPRALPIKRHVKVKGEANPYDPTYETYFEEREGAHMLETFRASRTLRYLWYEQRGLCTQCHTKITRITAGAFITASLV
jgi:RNA-directed DNA polymerase